MCRRHSLFAPARVLEERFDATLAFDAYKPRYNMVPGDSQAVITNESPSSITAADWGLRPAWMDASASGFANARSETAAEKPSFRSAWKERPCLVLTSGFYEWQDRAGTEKQPYRIYRAHESAFAMAGLWEPGVNGGESVPTVTILTTEPNELLAPIHDRMPVILPRNKERQWLHLGPDERTSMCTPLTDSTLRADAISTRVNSPQNDDPGVIEPIDDPQRGLFEFS